MASQWILPLRPFQGRSLVVYLLGVLLAACSSQAIPTTTSRSALSFSLEPNAIRHVVEGTVYDYATDTPIAGATVLVSKVKPGAFFRTEAATNGIGRFRFTLPAGKYVLEIAASTSYAVLHQTLTVKSRTEVTGVVPSPEPKVTYQPSQLSGQLRLMSLNPVQVACLTSANSYRTQLGLPLFQPDEYLEEDALAVNTEQSQAAGLPVAIPLWTYNQPNGVVVGYAGGEAQYQSGTAQPFEIAACQHLMALTFTKSVQRIIYNFAVNPKNIYFGIDYEGTKPGSSPNGWFSGFEAWNPDLRTVTSP